jgi:hypothetical protein
MRGSGKTSLLAVRFRLDQCVRIAEDFSAAYTAELTIDADFHGR